MRCDARQLRKLACATRRQGDKAPKTLNDYLDAARAFLNWMVEMERAPLNPLLNLGKVDTRGQEVRIRRALSCEEMTRLLAVAGKSRIGYLFAVHTGLHRNELKTLIWRDVRLDAPNPYVVVQPKNAKNRKGEPLPLHTELITELRAVKPLTAMPNDLVFTGRMLPCMAKVKSDLMRAGIEFIEDGRRADFHALRHTLGTNLSITGAGPRLAMGMMRHSDMKLTLKLTPTAAHCPLRMSSGHCRRSCHLSLKSWPTSRVAHS